MFLPLYAGDWLRTRSAHIQSTDGLIELGDLMHLESLPLQRSRFDVHVSGYIGDAVSGPTFAGLRTADDVLASLPWYGASISLPYGAARGRACCVRFPKSGGRRRGYGRTTTTIACGGGRKRSTPSPDRF